MEIHLPSPIDTYFAKGGDDIEFIDLCFIDTAVVKDEGSTYQGLAEIKQWRLDSFKAFSYTSEPIAYEERDSKVIVTGRVTGNFPRSPVDLRYYFELDGNKIAHLEIRE